MSIAIGKVFHVSALGNETVKQSPQSCNAPRNGDETASLKGLARKVLSRNNICNKNETTAFLDETAANQPLDREFFDERAAIIESNGVPREWAEGYAVLCTTPCPSAYTPQRWQQLVNDGGLFLDRWGRQAAGLGWRAVDVFGVNPDAPENRYDNAGLVPLLQGRPVVAITTDAARIDGGNSNYLTYYRKTLAAGALAVWKLGKT